MPRKLTTKDFIERATEKHNGKYDYSKVEYINSKIKVCIICPIHGEFWQLPSDHLFGRGCDKCRPNIKSTTEEFIIKAKIVHGDKYNYSKVEYINNRIPVIMGCQEHGDFIQKPLDHLAGCGCQICGGSLQSNTEEWIEKAKLVHGDKYDYSESNYTKALKNIYIICKEEGHGGFWQIAANHLNGSNCPKCNSNKKSKTEEYVSFVLTNNNIEFIREKGFKWLKYIRRLSLDFYLPEQKIAIEVQGEQHFVSIERYGGEKDFILRQDRDRVKLELCIKNGIKMIYIRKDLSVLDDLINSIRNETTD